MLPRRPRRSAEGRTPGGAAVASAGSRTHRIRIVGGRWKRTPLNVADRPGLRPSPDRVRETLFNWLGARIEGARCLDLFAGTGVLGLEAASRGASLVCLVELDRGSAAAIRDVVARLQGGEVVQVLAGDALAALKRFGANGQRFDVVFVDPPFDSDLLARAIDALPPVLADGALVYVEAGESFSAPAPWNTLRRGHAGAVHYHLLQFGQPTSRASS